MAKKKSAQGLDVGILTSVDEKGRRLGLIPAEVSGFYRRHRVWFHWLLLFIFLALPWTSVNGLQTILLNVPERKFVLLGAVFRAHDVPLLFFIVALAAIGLAFVTHLWGRVWCGWACPQTVFVETVFRGLERLTQGSYLQRRRLKEAPWGLQKIWKVALKWGLFTLVSFLISHSFMAYFVGGKELMTMMQRPPQENSSYFLLALFFTGLTLFDFGWFREQFCVIMCPYGRLQSVLLDKSSLAVVYDQGRGEPRRGLAAPGQSVGDCVSCNRCVEVCPTGIDIRNGLQMECIACTACIDACDEIMTKVKKPKGLIRYDTLDGSKITLKNPRALFYLALIILLSAGLIYALSARSSFHVTLLRGKGAPFTLVADAPAGPQVLNQFHLHLQNQSFQEASYELSLSESAPRGLELSVAQNPITLAPGESREWFFFLRFPEELTHARGTASITVEIKEYQGGETSPTSSQPVRVPVIGPSGGL